LAILELTPFRSQRRLAAEVARLRGSIADRLGDIVSTHDPGGTYRYVSVAATDILGFEPKEIVGRHPSEYVHPEDRPKLEIVNREVLRGTPSMLAYRVRRKDNEYIWLETTFRAVTDDESGRVSEVVCSSRPIAERTRTERLESSEYGSVVERVTDAIASERLETVYQPIFELDTGRVVAFEALSRFPGPSARGPDVWFEEAWEVGLGVPLELLAVRTAVGALRDLPADVKLGVNASSPTILSEAFLDSLGPEAHRVKVELTEHLRLEDYEGFSSRLAPLRDAGVELVIDDFGAGYASLRHILKIRPEWIKLDISLTEQIGENPLAHALATALVSFSEQTNVRVVAEGIETEEELDALCEIGFAYGQGFHLGVPAPLDEALAHLS
jgi:PAS domain S-box-containing protein